MDPGGDDLLLRVGHVPDVHRSLLRLQAYAVGESATGIVLALGAAAFFVASVRGAPFLVRLSRPRVVAVTVLFRGR